MPTIHIDQAQEGQPVQRKLLHLEGVENMQDHRHRTYHTSLRTLTVSPDLERHHRRMEAHQEDLFHHNHSLLAADHLQWSVLSLKSQVWQRYRSMMTMAILLGHLLAIVSPSAQGQSRGILFSQNRPLRMTRSLTRTKMMTCMALLQTDCTNDVELDQRR